MNERKQSYKRLGHGVCKQLFRGIEGVVTLNISVSMN